MARDGRVIGMVSAIYGRTYGPDALTLMISSSGMRAAVDQLARSGQVTRSEIGIIAECKAGSCRLSSVEPGGPAHTAGLREGDAVVTVDGTPPHTESQLRRMIAAKSVGSTILLAVARGNQLSTVAVVTRQRAARPR